MPVTQANQFPLLLATHHSFLGRNKQAKSQYKTTNGDSAK